MGGQSPCWMSYAKSPTPVPVHCCRNPATCHSVSILSTFRFFCRSSECPRTLFQKVPHLILLVSMHLMWSLIRGGILSARMPFNNFSFVGRIKFNPLWRVSHPKLLKLKQTRHLVLEKQRLYAGNIGIVINLFMFGAGGEQRSLRQQHVCQPALKHVASTHVATSK